MGRANRITGQTRTIATRPPLRSAAVFSLLVVLAVFFPSALFLLPLTVSLGLVLFPLPPPAAPRPRPAPALHPRTPRGPPF